MNDLTITQANLPDTLEDLSKFVLIGREKLTAVKANIRAIDKLQLAEDVREQKKEEAQMLGEALLDAEVRIGDLLKQIPKASGKRTDLTSSNQCEEVNKNDLKKPIDTNVDKLEIKIKNDNSIDFEKMVSNSSVDNQKTKKQVIEELGFNQKQAERFEKLSSNKDIVEQVKAEARENEDIPTRSRALQLIEEKSKEQLEYEKECEEIQKQRKIQQHFMKTISNAMYLTVDDEHIEAWLSDMKLNEMQEEIECTEKAIDNLKDLLIEAKKQVNKNRLKVVK